MKRPQPQQPTVTSRTRVETPAFYGQELPDPEGHLSEEQKKWPVVTELLSVGGMTAERVTESAVPTPKSPAAPPA